MIWLKTARQFLTLIFGVAMILSLFRGCISYMGYSQSYQRMEHDVLIKSNNYIKLDTSEKPFVFKKHRLGRPLIKELSSMTYHLLTAKNLEFQINTIEKSENCLFLDFKIENLAPKEIDQILKPLEPKNCVFFNTPFLKIKSYFAYKKPRWFYNITEVDLQKSRFLTSIGLQSVSPLRGDFIVIDTKKAPVAKALISELRRRHIVIFFN